MKIIEVIGNSMKPSICDGEFVFLSTNKKKDIKRNSIVLINHIGKNLVKRIIGLPNEKIKVSSDGIQINNQSIELGITNFSILSGIEFQWETKTNEFIVLGDNLEDSLDSRKFGKVNQDSIKGVVKVGLWPIKRIR